MSCTSHFDVYGKATTPSGLGCPKTADLCPMLWVHFIMWAIHILLVWILHRILLFHYLFCRVTKDGAELLQWEQDVLGLELVESQFPGAGPRGWACYIHKNTLKEGGPYCSIHCAILGFIQIRNRSLVSPNVLWKSWKTDWARPCDAANCLWTSCFSCWFSEGKSRSVITTYPFQEAV